MLTAIPLLCAALFPAEADVALRGLDPVALCGGEETEGRADLEETRGRFTYRFASDESRARFLADPERWGIQWGGGCARMGPLSGHGSPDRWAVYKERIYVFASEGCREGFLAAPERYVVAPPRFPTWDDVAGTAGVAWIAKAVDAHGGAAAIDAKIALRLGREGEQGGWKQGLELLVTRKGELRRQSTWIPPEDDQDSLDTVWVLARHAFREENGERLPFRSPDQLRDLRSHAHREPLALLWTRGAKDFLAIHRGSSELGGVKVEDVQVRTVGIATTLHLDAKDGRIRGLSWRGRINDGQTRDVVETFTEWKDVGGVLLPIARTVAVDGEPAPALTTAWTTAEFLSEVPADAFPPREGK